MLRYLLFCLLFGCATISTWAQEDGEPVDDDDRLFRFSVWVAGNAAQIDGDDLAGYDKLGLNIGGRVFIRLHENWQPSIGINYTQKGSSSELLGSSDLQTKYSLDYAQIPVMFNYVDQRIIFSVGLAYGQLVRSSVVRQGLPDDGILDLYRNFDFSFIGGATFFVTDHIGFTLAWERSLINLITDPTQQSQVNKLITLGAGYQF
ncbi:MAG: outer membrane beta-barrel protein [Bacteroidota bacterium]